MKKQDKYKLTLETSSKEFKTEAKNIEEAFELIPLEWNTVKAKGVVTISKGNKSYQHLFQLFPLRRIFANKLTRQMWAKRLNMLLESEKEKSFTLEK